MGKLEDRVALITGSDSGIGQASAVEFAREGADVVINYLHDEQGANRTKAESRRTGSGRSSSRPTTAMRTRWSGCSAPRWTRSARSTS